MNALHTLSTRSARSRNLILLLLLAVVSAPPTVAGPTGGASPVTDRVTVSRAGTAAVAAPDRHGADVAEAVMRRGGNAVDAAVATAFALAVTYPEAGNLGGGGFITLKMGDETAFLDFREVAPQAATRDMYLDAQGKPIPDASLIGHRAAGVPGTVAGLWEVHQRFGSRPWRELLQPAIRLARDGFVPHPQLVERVTESLPEYAGKTNFAA